jgi:hypothetical protein
VRRLPLRWYPPISEIRGTNQIPLRPPLIAFWQR